MATSEDLDETVNLVEKAGRRMIAAMLISAIARPCRPPPTTARRRSV